MIKPLELDLMLRRAIQQDPRIIYALAYGSLTQGTSDQFSDVEYYLYPTSTADFDVEAWLTHALKPSAFRILHRVVNEFGTPNFILTGLLRAELHVQGLDTLPDVLGWPSFHIFPQAMVVKDPDGRLLGLLNELAAQPLPEPDAEAQQILDRTLNWWVFGMNVLARGERIRALELLGWTQAGLLRLARLADQHPDHTAHWLNASRLAEQELTSPRGCQEHV